MSARFLAAATIVVVALTAVVVVLTQAPDAGGASSLSRRSGGWLAMRRTLEARGDRVDLLDHDIDRPLGGTALVLAFPRAGFDLSNVEKALDAHLHGGGSVLFAYSKDPSFSEERVAKALGLDQGERRERPPVNPLRFRRYAKEEWLLTPEGASGPAVPSIRVWPSSRAPLPPNGASILARDPKGRAAAFAYARADRGRVVVVPSDALSNARIDAAGNVALLEAVRRQLGPWWSFDEYHHGLRPPLTAEGRLSRNVVVLWLLQAAFVYGLVVFGVMRRFGPSWVEPTPSAVGTTTFLLGLGRLHDELGHHADGARLLRERWAQWSNPGAPPAPTDGPSEDLLTLARSLGATTPKTGALHD